MIAGIDEEAGLENGLGQLLDEQRHAFRLGQDLVSDLGRQGLAAAIRSMIADPSSRPRRLSDNAVTYENSCPSRLELGAESDDQQYRQVLKAIDQHVEPFAGRRVDPMGILDDHHDGLPRRDSL